MAYRVPRRFIVPPDEPPPYGVFVLSFLGHAFFFLMAAGISGYLSAQADQSKIYIVNLVPAAPSFGSPEPRPVAPPVPRVVERTPPRPEPVSPPRAQEAPPKPERALEAPTPPRAPEVARATPPRPSELTLPRKAEKETPALETPAARARLAERPLPPPPAPSVTPPPTPAPEPRVAPPPPAPLVAVARPGVEPMRLGRPDAPATATASISLDVSDFPWTLYLRTLQRKIAEQWSPPRAATAGGERVVILFELGRDGQLVKEPAVERSSGNTIYDQSALRAVLDANPFPPLPADFKASSLKVHFGFEFRPDQG